MSPIIYFLASMIPGTFFLGIYDVLTKRILKKEVYEGALLGATLTISGFLLFLISSLVGYPQIKPAFWPAFSVTIALNIFGQLAWYKAFKREDVSVIVPLRLLVPPLVLVTGFFVLNETPSLWGIFGVAITIVGLWLLMNLQANFTGRSLIKTILAPGVLWGLAGALSFSISFPFDKKSVINSSALFFSGTAVFIIGLASFLIAFFTSRSRTAATIRVLWLDKKLFVLNLISQALANFLTIYALNFAVAAYAASLKRLSVFWSIILSGRLLEEKNILQKLIAAAVMLLGVAIMIFLG